MYVLQSGRVRITKDQPQGARTLAILGPGEFFGEMAILNDKPRTATADALDEVRALVLDNKMFEAMVVGNTEIAVRLIKKLSRRLDSANALIEILLEQDPRVRVILGGSPRSLARRSRVESSCRPRPRSSQRRSVSMK